MSLEVITGFDGSCPQSDDGVHRDAEGCTTFFPARKFVKGKTYEWTEGGGHFYTRIRNTANAVVPFTGIVDWRPASERNDHADIGFIRHESATDWEMIPGIRNGACVRYELRLAPGMTELGLFPGYNTETCRAFVERARSRGVRASVAGKSREGRDIWLLNVPSDNPEAKTFLLQARDHPYESAGSFCVEGVADFLLSGDRVADYIRSKFNIHILPMSNPDGVYHGLSRRTREGGADMNRIHTEPDEAHDTVKRVIDTLRPDVYMNIHNFMHKFKDGLYSHEGSVAEKVRVHMPSDWAHHKRWDVATHADYLKAENVTETPPHKKSWKNYCAENFHAVCVTFELPWFGRSTADMRHTGRMAFTALALAAVEERNF